MLADGVVEQWFEQRGAFSIGDAPGDDPAAENIDDDIEIEVAPFRRPHQLRYVPGPNLIWAFGEKFRLLIDGAPQLPAPFADFVGRATGQSPRIRRIMLIVIVALWRYVEIGLIPDGAENGAPGNASFSAAAPASID